MIQIEVEIYEDKGEALIKRALDEAIQPAKYFTQLEKLRVRAENVRQRRGKNRRCIAKGMCRVSLRVSE